MLTGEPFPAAKEAAAPRGAPADDAVPCNMVFMGSSVVSGTAKALVLATGRCAQLGTIAQQLQKPPPSSAFAVGIRDFGLMIVRVTVLLVLFVLLANLLMHRPLLGSFLFALALAVGLTPELLPMVVSVTLAYGAIRLSRNQVIVKRLAAIHDLGSMDVLCSDKTGTLTDSRIKLVRQVDLAGQDCAAVLQTALLNAAFETGLKSPLDEAILAAGTLDRAAWRKVDDQLDPGTVTAMMQAGHGGPDSLHRLVMGLHKRLNAKQAAMAEEKLDGAAIYNLGPEDRPLVAAFMAGVNRTAGLKFDHPGLATTATRAGGRLVIQNDIGTTDAHVIVVHVEGVDAQGGDAQGGSTGGRSVSVTYTDVHAERLAFFQDMLHPYPVAWEGARTAVLAAGAPFYLATGRLDAADVAACCAYLEFLGSRLVFLIDWNRARKGLRGFLELGGAKLVNRAIEASAGSAMHFGDRLCDVLGDAEVSAFLRFVLQAATESLLAGGSQALVHDRIQVALAGHFSNEERQLLRLAGDHAGLVFELASLVRDGLQAEGGADKRARRARRFEHDADQFVLETRETVRRRPDYAVFLPLLQAADDAADALEDAVFLLDLDPLHGDALDALQTLAGLVADASQEWVKAVGHASQIGKGASAAETEDFLAAADRVAGLEREADGAERALAAAAVRHAKDFRQLHLFIAVGGKLEAASDALRHASLILRDHVLEDVVNG